MRWVFFVLRAVVAIVPATLIALWGWGYWTRCAEVLLDPQRSVVLDYQAKGGKFVVEAQRYRVQLTPPRVELSQVAVRDSKRTRVSAQRIQVDLGDLRDLQGSRKTIHVESATADLVLRKDGQLDALDFQPVGEGEPAVVPFEVRIDTANLTLRDERRPAAAPLFVRAFGTRVVGAGDSVIAGSRLDARDVGGLRAEVQVEGADMLVKATTSGVQLKPVLDRLALVPVATMPQMRTATFRGSAWVKLAGNQVFALGSGESIAGDIQFEDTRVDRANFTGWFTESGASGFARAAGHEVRVSGPLRASWSPRIRVAFHGSATSASATSLPESIRKQLGGVSWREAEFRGQVRLDEKRPSFAGALAARRLAAGDELLASVAADVSGDTDRVRWNLREGTWNESRVRSAGAALLPNGTLRGVVSASGLGLARYSTDTLRLSGLASAEALVSGSIRQPKAEFAASAQGVIRSGQTDPVRIETLKVRGAWDSEVLDIQSLAASGPGARLVGSGSLSGKSLKSRNLVATLDLSRFQRDVTGVVELRGELGGDLSRPTYRGIARSPLITARKEPIGAFWTFLHGNAQVVRADDVTLVRDAAGVFGGGQIRWADGAIHGKFAAQNLSLSVLDTPEIGGILQAERILISGTATQPKVSVSVRGQNLVAFDRMIDRVAGKLELRDGTARVRAEADLAGGTAKIAGLYGFEKRDGTFALTLDSADLSRLVPEGAEFATVRGTVRGDVQGSIRNGNVENARGEGLVRGLSANDSALGDGDWEALYDGQTIAGRLDVGFLDRFVSLTDLKFEPKAQSGSVRLDALNLPVEDIVQGFSGYLERTSPEDLYRLREASGRISIGADLRIVGRDWSVAADSLAAGDLKYSGIDLGKLSVKLEASQDSVELKSLEWDSPTGRAQAAGKWNRDAAIEATGELSGLQLGRLAPLAPGVAAAGGTLDVPFRISGTTEKPELRASAIARGLFARPGDEEATALRFVADTIEVIPNADSGSRLMLEGAFFYRGFQGLVTGSAPLEPGFRLDDDAPIALDVRLATRPLSEIVEFTQWVDAPTTSGEVSGEIQLRGTASQPAVSSNVKVSAAQLNVKGFAMFPTVGTQGRNVVASVELKPEALFISGKADGSRGGTLSLSANAPAFGAQSLFRALREGTTGRLLDQPVSGSLAVNQLAVRQEVTGGGLVEGRLDAALVLSGIARRPQIKGTATGSGLDVVVPALQPTEAGDAEPVIDPEFDIAFQVAPFARLRTANVELAMAGGGRVFGPLSQIGASADFVVERGQMRLPGGLVRITRGGQVGFLYQPQAFNALTSLSLDLVGTTSITAIEFGETPTRYDVVLEITGDLLREQGLIINGSSDPPGLSRDRILALLGQTDILTAIGSETRDSDSQERLRNALVGFAVPSLFDRVGAQLAQGLGLEYLTLEYNAYDQASVVFAKALSDSLIFTGRRQLSEPPPGFDRFYDVRLVYRPPFSRGVLSRVRLSVGTDELRPWKIALEYGVRF
jgi:hypothetical protein